MPFWSAVLRGRVAYVVAVRHPLEVSDSLASRNGFTEGLSLSLWERYTRQAMLGAVGSPMLLCTYDEVLAEPVGWCERLAAFFKVLGVPTSPDRPAIRSFVSEGLRHSRRSWSELDSSQLSPAQLALADAVGGTPVVEVAYSPPALPEETPHTELTFAEMRQGGGGSSAVAPLSALPPHLIDPKRRAAGPGRATQSPATIVVAVPGDARERSVRVLSAGLVPGSEVVVVGDRTGEAGPVTGESRPEVRHVRLPEASGGGAAGLALGAQSAEGRLVVLCAGPLSAVDAGWYGQLSLAFGDRNVAAATLSVIAEPGGRGPMRGRKFTGPGLAMRDSGARGDDGTVALLPELLCVINREVLTTAGGVDGQFETTAAAIAELSLRLWRLGFRCVAVPGVEARYVAADVQSPGAEPDLRDRLRIARLHFAPTRLQEFERRAQRNPAYRTAADKLAATDIEGRRAAIEAICAFSSDQYFRAFPPRFRLAHETSRRTSRVIARLSRRASQLRSE